nr:hypothetical protein GCM10020093_037570 [Planobispora longispora]
MIEQPVHRLGAKAAEVLLDAIAGGEPARETHTLRSRLIARSSVALPWPPPLTGGSSPWPRPAPEPVTASADDVQFCVEMQNGWPAGSSRTLRSSGCGWAGGSVAPRASIRA